MPTSSEIMSQSHYTFAPELEEQLNDIDEFIRGQCGDELSAGLQSDLCGANKVGETPALHSNTWNIKGSDPRLMAPSSPKIGHSEEVFLEDTGPETLGPGVEVQIVNLMDSYDKRSKKVCGKYEYRLGTSEVTMMIRANDEIRKVRVHVQRCRQAGARTHDTIGPVELQVNTQQSDNRCTMITVNLDSVHKTEHWEPVYRLEKAEIMERYRWELIVTVELATGVIASVKSKPFRITTRINQRSRNLEHQPDDMENDVHRVYHKIPSQCCEVIDYSELPESPEFMELEEIALESLDTNAIVNRVSSKLRQELAKCHINDGFPSPSHSSPPDPYVIGRVVLRPDTKLDKQKVSNHYNRDLRIRYVVEQPDLPSLLKLMNRRTTCMTSGRRRANGFKTAEEDFWWACGLCFFERRKKSTVKAHVVQRVCQKTSLRKEIRQRRRVFGHMKRYSSCELNSRELEEFEPLPWETSLSV